MPTGISMLPRLRMSLPMTMNTTISARLIAWSPALQILRDRLRAYRAVDVTRVFHHVGKQLACPLEAADPIRCIAFGCPPVERRLSVRVETWDLDRRIALAAG